MKTSLYIFITILCSFIILSGASPQKPIPHFPVSKRVDIPKKRNNTCVGVRNPHQASYAKPLLRSSLRR
jgi:hypothetical protein